MTKDNIKNLFKDPKKRNITVLVAAAVVLLVIIAIIAVRCGRTDAKDIVGTYEIVSVEGEDNSLSADDIEQMKDMDLTMTLDVRDDATAVMDVFGEKTEITYDLGDKTMEIDGQKVPFTYEDKQLEIKQNGSVMIFKKTGDKD